MVVVASVVVVDVSVVLVVSPVVVVVVGVVGSPVTVVVLGVVLVVVEETGHSFTPDGTH